MRQELQVRQDEDNIVLSGRLKLKTAEHIRTVFYSAADIKDRPDDLEIEATSHVKKAVCLAGSVCANSVRIMMLGDEIQSAYLSCNSQDCPFTEDEGGGSDNYEPRQPKPPLGNFEEELVLPTL